MSRVSKMILSIFAVGMIGIGLFFYVSLFGTPWGKVYYKYQLKDYLANKYKEEMVVTKAIYNFKDGSYGVSAYVKNRPEIKFSAWAYKKSYGDYYPEALWEEQVNKDFKDILEELYPDAERKRFHGVMGISRDMEITGGEVPHYLEVNPYFRLGISEEKKLTEDIKEEEIDKVYQLIELFKERDVYFDIFISYYDQNDDTKNSTKYIRIDFARNKKYPTREEVEGIFDKEIKRNR